MNLTAPEATILRVALLMGLTLPEIEMLRFGLIVEGERIEVRPFCSELFGREPRHGRWNAPRGSPDMAGGMLLEELLPAEGGAD